MRIVNLSFHMFRNGHRGFRVLKQNLNIRDSRKLLPQAARFYPSLISECNIHNTSNKQSNNLNTTNVLIPEDKIYVFMNGYISNQFLESYKHFFFFCNTKATDTN